MSIPRPLSIRRIDPAERSREGAWAGALRGFDPGAAQTLKAEGASRVFRCVMLGREVVVKVRGLDTPLERLKWMLSATRGFRQWRGAAWLLDHGFDAARPIVLASDGSREWLVLEAITGRTLLEAIAARNLPVREEHAIARSLGGLISAMASAGRFNRDFKPSNLMLRRTPDGWSLAGIDCVAIRRGGGAATRMLHALAVEPLGLGVLPRRALMARVIWSLVEAESGGVTGPARRSASRASRRASWDRVAESLRRHGDPTPRIHPLANPG